MIEVEHFSFSYDETEPPILNDLSFSIHKGESVLLLGPSGSGKSSLALCLNGLYPTSVDGYVRGSIKLKGKNLEEYKPGEASTHIGVVFQDPEAQFCMLTVEDEVAFGLENRKVPREEMAERIMGALALVGLENELTSTISSLSGGMKQKLALACVVAMKPELIILDEPTALLDPLATKEFSQTMAHLQKELGFALLVIEHKLDHWLPMMDRCLVLNNEGRLSFDGAPRVCFSQHLQELKAQGVWLPKPLLLFERLGGKHPIPFTEEELLQLVYPEDISALPLENMQNSNHVLMETVGLWFTKGQRNILQGIDTAIPVGSLTAVVGPNGAGKSTFSYLLAGLVKATRGDVKYNGALLSSLSDFEISKTIGYVFQNPEHQFVTDSVYEEIAFSLKMQKLKEDEIGRIVDEILAVCRLQKMADQHPFTLSQGQKRRLSVATMLVDEQPLMILDEPTYGQDANTAAELMALVADRMAKGCAVLMITHDMELVASHADQVIVLTDGKVSFQGTPHQLFSSAASIVQSANLELPLVYSLQQKAGLRGDSFVAANT